MCANKKRIEEKFGRGVAVSAMRISELLRKNSVWTVGRGLTS